MHTHAQHVMETTSGQPFRPDRVICVNWGRNDTQLRIVLDCGEVISDHWPTTDDARAFMAKVKFAMRGIAVADHDPQVPVE